MSYLNFNGAIIENNEAFLPASNMAFRQGVGLIETMLWENNQIRFIDLHVTRLQQSLKQLSFVDVPEEQFEQAIREVIAANDNPEYGMVRAQFYQNADRGATDFLIEFFPLERKEGFEQNQSLSIGIAEGILKVADHISSCKSSSRLPYHLAKQIADANKWHDALLLNQFGRIVESTIANIFWIKGRSIFTPPRSEGCVDGVFRCFLLKNTWSDFRIVEQPLEHEALKDADEIFLTNAVRGIRPVSSFQGKKYEQTLTRKLIQVLNLSS